MLCAAAFSRVMRHGVQQREELLLCTTFVTTLTGLVHIRAMNTEILIFGIIHNFITSFESYENTLFNYRFTVRGTFSLNLFCCPLEILVSESCNALFGELPRRPGGGKNEGQRSSSLVSICTVFVVQLQGISFHDIPVVCMALMTQVPELIETSTRG